jgi:CIC family chloride channel protein
MAAYFTAIVRAPLTGIVLIIEMTGNYAQMLPLLVACFCAYAVAEGLGELPIYEHLLERDLMRGGALPDPKAPLVLEIEVEPGSPFDGREVRALGLPPGCILVSCREGDREWIPTAGTRLAAHTRLTAVVAPEARGAVAVLRHGCEAAE